MNEELEPLGIKLLKTPAGARRPPATTVEIDKGDDEEHAELALGVVRDDIGTSSVMPVFCCGAWWAYYVRQGTWIQVPTPKVKKAVLWLKHIAHYIDSKGETRRVVFSAGKAKAIYDMMKLLAGDDEFFEGAAKGMCFKGDTSLLFGKTGRPSVVMHSPMLRLRSYFNFPLKPSAGCPKWEAFLESLFRHDVDKAEKIGVLQEFIGAAMRSQACLYEKALLLYGSGKNGKSIFCDIVSRLFTDGICAVNPQDLNDERKIVALDGANLNMVSDMSVRGFKDSGGWKQSISGDLVSARRLYAETFTFRPTSAHIYSVNDLPRSPDLTPGFYRRWMIIEFGRTFTAQDSTPRAELMDSLIEELPGIATWALRGGREVMKRGGFLQPSSSGLILDEWSAENNTVQQFMVTATAKSPEHDIWTESRLVYEAYKDWSSYNGHVTMSSTLFNRRVAKLGYEKRRGSLGLTEVKVEVKPKRLWAEGGSYDGNSY